VGVGFDLEGETFDPGVPLDGPKAEGLCCGDHIGEQGLRLGVLPRRAGREGKEELKLDSRGFGFGEEGDRTAEKVGRRYDVSPIGGPRPGCRERLGGQASELATPLVERPEFA
jgi:hypothetical protein